MSGRLTLSTGYTVQQLFSVLNSLASRVERAMPAQRTQAMKDWETVLLALRASSYNVPVEAEQPVRKVYDSAKKHLESLEKEISKRSSASAVDSAFDKSKKSLAKFMSKTFKMSNQSATDEHMLDYFATLDSHYAEAVAEQYQHGTGGGSAGIQGASFTYPLQRKSRFPNVLNN